MSKAYLVLFRTLGYFKGQKKRYIAGSVLSAASLLIALATPYLYRQIVIIITNGRSNAAITAVIELFAVLILLTPLVVIGDYMKQTAGAECTANLRKSLFDHILRLPVTEATERKTGDYFQRLTGDVRTATGFLTGYGSVALLKFFVYSIATIILLLRVSPVLAATGLVLGALSAVFSNAMKPLVRQLETLARQSCGILASQFIETLRSLPIVKVFLLHAYLSDTLRRSADDILKNRVKYRTVNGIMYSFVYLFTSNAQPIGFLVGVLFLLRGPMQMVDIVYAAGLIAVLADGMDNLNSFIVLVQPAIVAGKRVFDLLDETAEQEREAIAEPDTSNPAAILFKDVSFAYKGGQNVLNNVSFTVEKGKTAALVGGSGGGKTTLMKLLQDFYEVDKGSISLFGCPLQNLSRKTIRGLSAYVPQEATVFDGTVAENIAAGRESATMEEIENAAKQAHIDDMIRLLPQGYDTNIGERGSQISGGQRQRIAIARAILKDAPILLLDEATAALDSETEQEVYKGITALMQGRTTVVAAHRLSTVRNADRILVIEHGQIVEIGKHEELIMKRGRYWQLCGLLED